ncbi:MAG: FG-GAP repeat protein [Phycisphaerae bacterium]|nr:FG-GAP repeat protein [Phycisphaerae bacterium]
MLVRIIITFFGDFSQTFGDIDNDGYDDVLIGAWGYIQYRGGLAGKLM